MAGAPETTTTEDVLHLSLQLGRLLLVTGADTAQVQAAVERFAAGLGREARLLVGHEMLLITVTSGETFRTKVGLPVAGTSVDLTAAAALNQIADEAAQGRLDARAARVRLAALEATRPSYPRWLVAASLGLTAASLAALFGGDGPVFVAVLAAGSLEILAQQQLRRWGFHPLAVTFVTALIGGAIGGLGMRIHPGATPALCLIAPSMILVPGVPLINAIRDAINDNMTLGLARLASALLVVATIGFGLFAATALTEIEIPITGAAPLLPIPRDLLFSALATTGFIFLFNIRTNVAWACVACGLCGHGLRTAAMRLGLDIVGATLIGSLAAGALAQLFSRRFRAPPATFAFPGVLSMVPGSYAFRAIIAGVQIVRSADAATPALVTDAVGLIVSTVMLSAAIAIGLAVPMSPGGALRPSPAPRAP